MYFVNKLPTSKYYNIRLVLCSYIGSNFFADNLRANGTIKSDKVKKGKEEYLEVNDFTFKFETDHMYLEFENLFDNDKKLGKSSLFISVWKECLIFVWGFSGKQKTFNTNRVVGLACLLKQTEKLN